MTTEIIAYIDSVLVFKESWGTYVKVEGWAFCAHSKVSKVEARMEKMPWYTFINKKKPRILIYGNSRPDVKKHFGSMCPSPNVGFYNYLPLTKEEANEENLTLRIAITTANGLKLKLEKLFSVKDNLTPSREVTSAELSAMTDPPVRLGKPNLFILGSAKCGTTSLHHALSQHPEIHLSKIKEPTFFTQRPLVVKNPIDYFNLFAYRPGKKYYGEASHANLSCPETASVLKLLFPEAKFLIILRNPVNRSYALYQHLSRNGEEPCNSFEEALEVEDKRFHCGQFRDRPDAYFWNYMYTHSSRYDLQLERYFALFPREQFFVMTLGEWKSDSRFWLQQIFRFLNVDPEIQINAEPKNQAPVYAPMADETYQILTEKFAGVRERVEALVGRRFDHWNY
jgi:hypothetical protein